MQHSAYLPTAPMNHDPERNTRPEANPVESERRKHLTLLWMQAQPVVGAYIASAVRDRQHGEDLLQETALVVAESFDAYDPARPFLPWAMGIARNKMLHYYRRHGSDRLVFDDELLAEIGSRFEARGDVMKEQRSALERCIGRLGERAQSALQMRYIDDMGYEQIAEAVGRSVAGVANLLYRARKALADCVKREASGTRGGDA